MRRRAPSLRAPEGICGFPIDDALFHLVNGSIVEQIPWNSLGIKEVGGRIAVDPLQGGLWIGFSQGGIAYLRHGQIERSIRLPMGSATAGFLTSESIEKARSGPQLRAV